MRNNVWKFSLTISKWTNAHILCHWQPWHELLYWTENWSYTCTPSKTKRLRPAFWAWRSDQPALPYSLNSVFADASTLLQADKWRLKWGATRENVPSNMSPSRSLHHPAHSRCLIRIFIDRILDNKVYSCGQWRLFSYDVMAHIFLSLI